MTVPPRALLRCAVARDRRQALAFLANAAAAATTGGLAAAAEPRPAPSTILVKPGDSLEQALRRATDGDRIDILAGEHRGQVAVIGHKRLTLRGVGGRPVLHAGGRSAEGKAILVVRDGDILIDNIEFRGARVADGNGAGIRFESGRLQVERCAFFDNQNGILAGNAGDAELSVIDSEFGNAPAATPLPHLLYVGRIARFSLSGCRFAGGRDGHLVKSRARHNQLRSNQLVDGAGGQAAYEIEFPNGGIVYLIGNVIGQSATSTNPVLLSFGAEGSDDREQGLFVAHNTFINAGLRPAWFVRLHKLPQPLERRFVNNLYIGLGVTDVAWADIAQGNFLASSAVLEDAEVGAYALARDSLLRGRGVAPGRGRGVALAPLAEFTPPLGSRALAAPLRWSPGAYQP